MCPNDGQPKQTEEMVYQSHWLPPADPPRRSIVTRWPSIWIDKTDFNGGKEINSR